VRASLSPFSYVILTLVGRGGASAHDIVQMMRRGRPYWAAAESHYYAEPKRLAELGYLAADTAPGKTTERRVYSLTPRGEEALRAWLAQPTGFPRIQNEAVVRVLASEYTDPATLLVSLVAMRAELDEIDADLAANLASAEALPHRARSIRLVTDLGQRLVQAHRDWLATVEADLSSRALEP
jgi:PadR family transcriptional regulator, regulatory protein AphA